MDSMCSPIHHSILQELMDLHREVRISTMEVIMKNMKWLKMDKYGLVNKIKLSMFKKNQITQTTSTEITSLNVLQWCQMRDSLASKLTNKIFSPMFFSEDNIKNQFNTNLQAITNSIAEIHFFTKLTKARSI